MKFKLSGFFYGMGTAIVVLSLVYYVVYNLDLRDKIKSVDLHKDFMDYESDSDLSTLSQNLTEAQIEELARGIGMVFPYETDNTAQ